jgi:transketolase
VSIAYANQNVKIVGTDPGISAEFNGGTHMSVEDIGVLRSIPNLVIFEPADNVQLKKALPKVLEYQGAVYIRMFRKAPFDVFDDTYNFDMFKADIIKEGKDVTVICTGIMLEESLKAGELLRSEGIEAEIINVHTLKPIDKESILRSAKKTHRVVTAENHSVIGGLGSAVSEVLSQNCPTMMRCIGINDVFGQVGRIPYLKKVYKMEAQNILDAARELVDNF